MGFVLVRCERKCNLSSKLWFRPQYQISSKSIG